MKQSVKTTGKFLLYALYLVIFYLLIEVSFYLLNLKSAIGNIVGFLLGLSTIVFFTSQLIIKIKNKKK